MADPPSASDILNLRVKLKPWKSVSSAVSAGARGTIYALLLYVVGVITGFVDIVTTTLRTLAAGAGNIISAFTGGITTTIASGFGPSVVPDLGPLTPFAAIIIVFGVGWLMEQGYQALQTDIPGIPGLNLIPFFGDDQE